MPVSLIVKTRRKHLREFEATDPAVGSGNPYAFNSGAPTRPLDAALDTDVRYVRRLRSFRLVFLNSFVEFSRGAIE